MLDAVISVKKDLRILPKSLIRKYNEESFDQIFSDQINFWEIPSYTALEMVRLPCKNQVPLIEIKDIIQDVQMHLDRLANKCERLIGNYYHKSS